MKTTLIPLGETIHVKEDWHLAEHITAKSQFDMSKPLWNIEFSVALVATGTRLIYSVVNKIYPDHFSGYMTRAKIKTSGTQKFKFRVMDGVEHKATIPTVIPAGSKIRILSLHGEERLKTFPYAVISIQLPKPVVLSKYNKITATSLRVWIPYKALETLDWCKRLPANFKSKRVKPKKKQKHNRFTLIGL